MAVFWGEGAPVSLVADEDWIAAEAAVASPLAGGRLAALRAGWRADRGLGLAAAAARALRRARVLMASGAFATLAGSECFAAHLAQGRERDPLFFLAQRHYLARDLPPRLRLAAAVTHYASEQAAHSAAYRQAVYRPGGLTLWQSADAAWRISLEAGQDVLVEGGLSVVLREGAARLCVLSFSRVPRQVVDPQGRSGLPETVHYITRKQLTQDRGYQAAFHAAFDRVTAGHLCFAALEGLILAEGGRAAVGILASAHPVHTPDLGPHLEVAYGDFWQTLGAAPLSARGVLIRLPVALSPLEEMAAAKRKRALARRAHLDQVRQAAQAVMAPLVAPG
jgi:hypothetical protein